MEPSATIAASHQYAPPPVANWPNAPVLITKPQTDGVGIHRAVVPLHRLGPNTNSEFPVESDLFHGKMYIAIKGIANCPDEYFRGKRRLFNIVVQGRFKIAGISFASVQTGQVFDGPLHLIPPALLLAPFRFLLEKLQPSVQMELSGARPYIVSPLMSTMQCIAVSRPGSEPAISSNVEWSEEDLSLVSNDLKGMSSSQRKSYFSREENLRQFTFDPNLVYTFNFYQDILDMASFEISLGFIHVDISRFLGRLPVSIMAAVFDPQHAEEDHAGVGRPAVPQYLYQLEVWHEKSFEYR